MAETDRKSREDAVDFKLPLGYKILAFAHGIESNLSESVYKFWCRLKGGRFQRREASRPNACILVTKRSSHLLATSIIFLLRVLRPFERLYCGLKNRFFPISSKPIRFGFINLNLLELEVYELNCPAAASFGQGQKEHSFAFKKKENCVLCGRCFEIRESDKKIVGSFYED